MGSDSDNLNIVVGPSSGIKVWCVLLSLGTAIASYCAWNTQDQELCRLAIAYVIFLGVMSFMSYLAVRVRWRATSKGIYIRNLTKEQFFPWQCLTIGSVKRSRVSGTYRRIQVNAQTGGLTFSSESVSRSFQQFAHEVVTRAKPPQIATLPARHHISRTFLIAGMVISVAVIMGILAFIALSQDVVALIFGFMMCWFAVMIILACLRAASSVSADAEGITLSAMLHSRHIPWETLEITTLVQHHSDSPIEQLVIHDGARGWSLHPLVLSPGFQPLARLLVQRGKLSRWEPPAFNESSHFVRFSRWYLTDEVVIMVGLAALLVALATYIGMSMQQWLATGVCFPLLFYIFGRSWYFKVNTLHATSDGLEITLPFRRIHIPWNELQVFHANRLTPEGKAMSLTFGTSNARWLVHAPRYQPLDAHIMFHIILTRAAHSPPTSH